MNFPYQNYLNNLHGLELRQYYDGKPRDNENGIYFLALLGALRGLNAGRATHQFNRDFLQICGNIRAFGSDSSPILGLYDREMGASLSPDKLGIRTISHDNLTGIACYSKLVGLYEHKYIAEYGRKHFWRFDNVYPGAPRWARFSHPRDIIFWSYLDGSWLAKPFMFFPLACCIWSCYGTYNNRPDLFTRVVNFFKTGKWDTTRKIRATSGKLLAFLRLTTLREKWWGELTWKFCTYLVGKAFAGRWNEVFSIYFGDENNPIRLEAAKYFGDHNV